MIFVHVWTVSRCFYNDILLPFSFMFSFLPLLLTSVLISLCTSWPLPKCFLWLSILTFHPTILVSSHVPLSCLCLFSSSGFVLVLQLLKEVPVGGGTLVCTHTDLEREKCKKERGMNLLMFRIPLRISVMSAHHPTFPLLILFFCVNLLWVSVFF